MSGGASQEKKSGGAAEAARTLARREAARARLVAGLLADRAALRAVLAREADGRVVLSLRAAVVRGVLL